MFSKLHEVGLRRDKTTREPHRLLSLVKFGRGLVVTKDHLIEPGSPPRARNMHRNFLMPQQPKGFSLISQMILALL